MQDRLSETIKRLKTQLGGVDAAPTAGFRREDEYYGELRFTPNHGRTNPSSQDFSGETNVGRSPHNSSGHNFSIDWEREIEQRRLQDTFFGPMGGQSSNGTPSAAPQPALANLTPLAQAGTRMHPPHRQAPPAGGEGYTDFPRRPSEGHFPDYRYMQLGPDPPPNPFIGIKPLSHVQLHHRYVAPPEGFQPIAVQIAETPNYIQIQRSAAEPEGVEPRVPDVAEIGKALASIKPLSRVGPLQRPVSTAAAVAGPITPKKPSASGVRIEEPEGDRSLSTEADKSDFSWPRVTVPTVDSLAALSGSDPLRFYGLSGAPSSRLSASTALPPSQLAQRDSKARPANYASQIEAEIYERQFQGGKVWTPEGKGALAANGGLSKSNNPLDQETYQAWRSTRPPDPRFEVGQRRK